MKKITLCLLFLGILFTVHSTAWAKHDKDNNPPGPAGGKGTNWENPPGPKGGPGASPDNNQAVWLRQGADTNNDGIVDDTEKKQAHARWVANHKKNDNDNNPPGPVGGKGTNWENPPGPKGGPGASPDRKKK